MLPRSKGGTMSEFNDLTALVTGSSRGIGARTVKLLASRGASVAVNYVSSEKRAEDVVEEITEAGGEAIAVQADVRDAAAVDAMVGEIEDEFGGIDALVNNARIGYEKQPLLEMDWEQFEGKLTGELKAAFNVTRAVLPGMIERDDGRIIYISTELVRSPAEGFIAHGTANGGLEAFSRYVATEYGSDGVTANVVAPGLARTEATEGRSTEFLQQVADQTPLDRVATPEDIARAVATLVSDDCRFVTGTYTPVNGGLTME